MRTSAGIVAPSNHWRRVSLRDRRCLIMLSSIPRRLSSDGYSQRSLQREEHLPGSCSRSRTWLLSLGHRYRDQQDHTSRRIVHRTTLETCQYVPDQWRKLHSAPRELLTTRRILREFHFSTDAVEDSPRKMFGCAAMITWPIVDAPSGRFALAASAAVSQTNDDGSDTIHQQRSGIDLASRINLLRLKRS